MIASTTISAFVLTFVTVVSCLTAGCTERQATPAPTAHAPPVSPEDLVSELKAAFGAPLDNCDNAKSEWFMREGALMRKLAGNKVSQDAALAHVVQPNTGEFDTFGASLKCALLHVLIAERDDARLVALVSQLPIEVDDADGEYIEFAIMDPFDNHQPVSRLALLFEAYDKATLPEVRSSLVRAVRRAFYHSIRPSWTDEEVMRRFRREIRTFATYNKVNMEYAYAYPFFYMGGNVVPAPLLVPSRPLRNQWTAGA